MKNVRIGGYIVRFIRFILASLSIAVVLSVLGCASVGGGQISGVNWALEKNGGRVSAFSEDPDHPTSTLINGITSSEGWDAGEGWQAAITISGGRQRRGSNRRAEEERNWVVVELSQPVTISQVKVYTVDSEQYPAMDFGVNSMLIQYELETSSKEMIWASMEKFGKGISGSDNRILDNVSGVISPRFKPVTAQRIRVLIYTTNDMERSEDNSRARQGMIRLTEIEIYGTGKKESRDDLDNLFGQ